MNHWQKMKIGDLFNIEKGSLQSSKCTVGDFDFITASSEWKTHNEYTHEEEALIVAVAASGSLGRVHYVNGKFISSDLCFILTPKNRDKYPLDFEFYFHILRSVRDDLVQSTATGTSKLAINKGNFSNYKLPYFDIEHQKKFCKKLINLENNKEKLNQNSNFQKLHLTILRQQILQDAISGKFTADWRAENPHTEPASKLLEQIKEEKEKLIAEKKIKKEKPLPKITEGEVPFELPEGWEWCRLGEIVRFSENNNIHSNLNENEIVHYVDIDAVNNKTFLIENVKEKKVKDLSSRARRVLSKGDIIYSLVRPYLNNIAIVQEDKPNYIGSTGFAVFSGIVVINSFIFNILLSDYIRKLYLEFLSGFNSPSVTHDRFKNTAIPLPPLAEQKAIVAKIEKLMEYVSQLEEKIAQSTNNAEALMQAFLGEVLGSN